MIYDLFSQSVAKIVVCPKVNSHRWFLVFKQSKYITERPFKLTHGWNHCVSILTILVKFFKINFACIHFCEWPFVNVFDCANLCEIPTRKFLATWKSTQVWDSLHECLSKNSAYVFLFLFFYGVLVASNNKKPINLWLWQTWTCPISDICHRRK